MDQEEPEVSLSLVQSPTREDPDMGQELPELIEKIAGRYGSLLPHGIRRQFDEEMGEALSLAHLQDYDVVTGLLNRRAAQQKFDNIIARTRNAGIGLVFADVDDFKDINSRFTRPGGDLVLKAIGRILRDQAREEDLLLGRLGDGADEFMAIIRHPPRFDDFDRMVYRIAEALNSRDVQRSAGYEFDHDLRISVGCALVNWPASSSRRQRASFIREQLYRFLSVATDVAKKERKTETELYQESRLVIPRLSIAVHGVEVCQTMRTYIVKP